MTTATERSPQMVKLVYFLHQYARVLPNGRSAPPEEFGEISWREMYEQFYSRFGASRSFDTFKNSAEGLRKGNISDHKDNAVPLLPKYEAILQFWMTGTRAEQWEEIRNYRQE